jgi:two-component system, LytTR family, response regulator
MKVNCVAIDDEPLALDIIKEYCSKVPFLNLMESFINPVDSIQYLMNNPVDLLFLDIQMDQLTGIQLMNVLKTKPMVIFTTAYDSFALQGYELDAIDYLLKPISFERFMKAVDKVYDKLQMQQHIKTEATEQTHYILPKDDYIFVKTEFRYEKIDFNDILYIEGMGDYLCIVTVKKKIMTLQGFKKMDESLPKNNFCRVHKSYIVSIDKIESVERNRIKIKEKLIPVSDSYKDCFNNILEKKKLS